MRSIMGTPKNATNPRRRWLRPALTWSRAASSVALAGLLLPVASEGVQASAAPAAAGGSISCSSDLPMFGALHVTRAMAPGTSGFLQLGWPTTSSRNHFIGNCVLSGMVPSGWTVAEAPYSALKAANGSGNAGTFDWDTDDSAFIDPGTFYNSGKFEDSSSGFSQTIVVGSFVNTGTVLSGSTGLSTAGGAASPVCRCTFVDDGTVRVRPKDVFSSGGTFDLATGGTIDAAGSFSIANLSTFVAEGGSVVSGALVTGQFLGQGPATIEFAVPQLGPSKGTIDLSTDVNVRGVIPKHWTLDSTGGSVAATNSGNAGTFIWGDTDDSTFSDTTTFVNSGTFADDATGFSQQFEGPRFVNTGTVLSNAPGFGLAAAPHVIPVFVDHGIVQVGPKGVFVAAGVFDLATGGTISNHGIFDYATTTLDLDGGTVTAGVLTNPYHLAAGPSTVEFESPMPAGSTGTIDVEIQTTLRGKIPKHWTVNFTGGSITAVSSGNNGTLNWGASAQLLTAQPFVNTGAVNDYSGDLEVSAPPTSESRQPPTVFVNAATGHILAKEADAGVMVTGNLSNYGSVQLGPNRLSVTGNYVQTASGSLELAIVGPDNFGFVTVDGRATLGGALTIGKLASYTAHSGDSQQILTAHTVSGTFRPTRVPEDGPGLVTKVDYGAGGVTLEVQKGA